MGDPLPGTPPLPDAVCDGGDLDCGSGLLLIIRNAMAPLPGGKILEVKSREISVKEDLPAWCRMVGHALVAIEGTSYYIRKKDGDDALAKDLDAARNYEWKVRVRRQGAQPAKAFVRNHSFVVGQPASFDTGGFCTGATQRLLRTTGPPLVRASQTGLQLEHR